MEKLYRRNLREWRKDNDSSMDAAVARAFDPRSGFHFVELGQARGADAIVLALKPEYAGDRVFAFGVGLASMIFLAYNEKTQFYLTDSFDPQKLYNSARKPFLETSPFGLVFAATPPRHRFATQCRALLAQDSGSQQNAGDG